MNSTRERGARGGASPTSPPGVVRAHLHADASEVASEVRLKRDRDERAAVLEGVGSKAGEARREFDGGEGAAGGEGTAADGGQAGG